MKYNNSLAAAFFVGSAVMATSVVLQYMPGIGSIFHMLMNPALLRFGVDAVSLQALYPLTGGILFYTATFFTHYAIENHSADLNKAKDSRWWAFANAILSMIGLNTIFKLSKHVAQLASFLSVLTGSAAIGTALFLLWTIGMPTLMGYVHYQYALSNHKGDATLMDSVYFAISLAIGAVSGWWHEWFSPWKLVNPFEEGSFGDSLTKGLMRLSFVDPESATLEHVVGPAFSLTTGLYFATRCMTPALDDRKTAHKATIKYSYDNSNGHIKSD